MILKLFRFSYSPICLLHACTVEWLLLLAGYTAGGSLIVLPSLTPLSGIEAGGLLGVLLPPVPWNVTIEPIVCLFDESLF